MGSAAASRQLGQTATAAQRMRTLSNTFTSTSRGSSDKSVASLSAGEGVQHRAQPLSEKRYALDVVMAKAAVKKRARDQMAAPLHFHWSYISVRLAPSAELSSQRLSRLRSQRLRAPSLVSRTLSCSSGPLPPAPPPALSRARLQVYQGCSGARRSSLWERRLHRLN